MNCPNCAAPLKPNRCQCEYCGSYYIDTTVFDLDSRTPTYINMIYQGKLITVRVNTCIPTIEINDNYTDIVNRDGYTVKRIKTDRDIHMTMDMECTSITVQK